MSDAVKVGGFAVNYNGNIVGHYSTVEECRAHMFNYEGLNEVGIEMAARGGRLEFNPISETLYARFDAEGYDVEYVDNVGGVLLHVSEVL